MTKQNQVVIPVLRGYYCIIATLACIFCLAMFISPVLAESYNFDLSVSQLNSFVGTQSGSSGGGVNQNPLYLYMNFSQITAPTDLVLQFNPSSTVYSTYGSISGTYGGNTIFTGTYALLNGSFSGSNAQINIHFTTFNKYTYTGYQNVLLTFITPLAPNTFVMMGYNGNGISQNIPIYFATSNAGNLVDGNYITNDNLFAKNSFYLNKSAANIYDIGITKNYDSTPYTSIIKIFGGTDYNTILYQDSSLNSINKNVSVYSAPFIIQATLLSTFKVNSSEYFSAPVNGYDITLSPISPSQNQVITLGISSILNGTLTGTALNELSAISIYDNTLGDNSHILMSYANASQGSYYLEKQLGSGKWFYYNTNFQMVFIGTTLSLPSFTENVIGNRDLSFVLTDTSLNNYYYTKNVFFQSLSGGAYVTVNLLDGTTGYGISGATLKVLKNGIWNNQTTFGTAITIPVDIGPVYGITCGNPPFYTTGDETYAMINYTFTGNRTISCNMYPLSINAAGNNATMNIQTVDDETYNAISGVSLVIKSPNNTYTGITSTAMAGNRWTGLVPINDVYTITASLAGYLPASITLSVTSADAAKSVDGTIYMSKKPVTTTQTIVYPTTVPTVAPTTLPDGVTCNPNFWATGGNIMNISGSLQNYVACQGVKSDQNQKAIVGILITLVLLSLGAKYGGKIGAVIATSAGYIIGILMGLFPIWTLILFCAIMGVVFAAKLLTAGSSK